MPNPDSALIFAFSNAHTGGNPAYVMVSAESGDENIAQTCMAIAAERRHQVTHMRFGPRADEARVAFYSPSGAMTFCGHGALAAAAWAAACGRAERRLSLHYDAGSIDIEMAEGGREVSYVESAGPLRSMDIDLLCLAALQKALGLADIKRNDVKLSVGGATRRKALIELIRPELLSHLTLDPAAGDLLCESLGVTGLYIFHVVDRSTVRARHFPKHGAGLEDMATGNIAPTLAKLLVPDADRPLLIFQGGPACDVARLTLTPADGAWRVGGTCRIVGR